VVEVFLESEVSPPSGTLERVSGIWDLGNLGGSLLRYDGGPEESELELPFEPACIPTGETLLALDGKLLMDIMLPSSSPCKPNVSRTPMSSMFKTLCGSC
jgi:hypothetical protein